MDSIRIPYRTFSSPNFKPPKLGGSLYTLKYNICTYIQTCRETEKEIDGHVHVTNFNIYQIH